MKKKRNESGAGYKSWWWLWSDSQARRPLSRHESGVTRWNRQTKSKEWNWQKLPIEGNERLEVETGGMVQCGLERKNRGAQLDWGVQGWGEDRRT